MKNVIIITSRYPFGDTEHFIEAELKCIPSDIAVQIFAVGEIESCAPRQYLPKNQKAYALLNKSASTIKKVWLMANALFDSSFYEELLYLVKNRKCSFRHIKRLFSYSIHSHERYVAIRNKLKEIHSEDIKENVLYSYWMDESALAIAKLAKKHGFRAICRAHGADLYEERNDGYLPYRRFIIKYLDRIFPVSKMGKEYLISKYGCETKIEPAYLGSINTTAIKNVVREGTFRIVTCSTIIPLKRVNLVAEAISRIFNKDIEWVHFGDGVDREKVFSIVESFPSNIVFKYMGQVSHDDVLSFYKKNSVHLFINVSTTEGLPVSIVEACSFGIPIIATDVGGVREVVLNKMNGLLITPDVDSTLLKDNILHFVTCNNDEYESYRRNSRVIWEKSFDATENYRKFFSDITR